MPGNLLELSLNLKLSLSCSRTIATLLFCQLIIVFAIKTCCMMIEDTMKTMVHP